MHFIIASIRNLDPKARPQISRHQFPTFHCEPHTTRGTSNHIFPH
ncbi:hypothetical protein [Rubritalea tangerina]